LSRLTAFANQRSLAFFGVLRAVPSNDQGVTSILLFGDIQDATVSDICVRGPRLHRPQQLGPLLPHSVLLHPDQWLLEPRCQSEMLERTRPRLREFGISYSTGHHSVDPSYR
jgi:hypothetical protein